MAKEEKVPVLFTDEARVRTGDRYDPVYEKGKVYWLRPDQAERWYRRNKAIPGPTETVDPVSEPDKQEPPQAITIPEDWRSLGWNELRSLASKISAEPITNKDDAIAAIEIEIESRAAADTQQKS